MTIQPFTGVLTAIATPFSPDLAVDVPAFKNLLTLQRDAGLHGVVVCGTTGESPTLSSEEKKLLVSTALEFQTDHFRIYVGTGSNSTAETLESTRTFAKFEAHGQRVAGVMVVTPYYNKPTQTGLKEHFLTIAKAIPDVPVCLYNVPGRTGCVLKPKTLVTIAKEAKNIVALKEAAGDLRALTELNIALKQANLCDQVTLLSGDDATFAPALLCGAKGIISVSTHIVPSAMLAMWKAARDGDFKTLQHLYLSADPINTQLFCAPNPIPLKWALAHLGICKNVLRPPLTPLENEEIMLISQALTSVQAAGLKLLK
jgi:4-hydroxy-tetrahydrodipicolinate synthase